MLTLFLHLRLAPKHVTNDLWIADAKDLDAIATPLSRIAARHSPIDGGPAGDLGDAIEVAIGVGGYGVKNIVGARELARPETWQQQDDADQAATGTGPEEPPAFQPFSP